MKYLTTESDVISLQIFDCFQQLARMVLLEPSARPPVSNSIIPLSPLPRRPKQYKLVSAGTTNIFQQANSPSIFASNDLKICQIFYLTIQTIWWRPILAERWGGGKAGKHGFVVLFVIIQSSFHGNI